MELIDEDRELILQLLTEADRLTPPQLMALGFWLAGFTHAEIAQIVGVSRRAVSRRIERAIAELRATSLLGEWLD